MLGLRRRLLLDLLAVLIAGALFGGLGDGIEWMLGNLGAVHWVIRFYCSFCSCFVNEYVGIAIV
jgi:hypothetical protein